MRIAEFSESSKFWTHIALSGYAWKYACISVRTTNLPFFFCVVRDRNGRCEVSRAFLVSARESTSPFKCTLNSLVFEWSVMLESQWSAWIVLRFRRLRLGHMEATSFCGMLDFGPTLQQIGCSFRSFLEAYLCCVRLELGVGYCEECVAALRRLRVKRSTPIWDRLLLRQWLTFTLDLISGKITRWT